MADNADLARLAFQEALTLIRISSGQESTDLILPADRISDAEYYVELALDTMHERGNGYDPQLHARANAEACVIEYVKERLLGKDPLVSENFKRGEKAWLFAAAQQGDHVELYSDRMPVFDRDIQKRGGRSRRSGRAY